MSLTITMITIINPCMAFFISRFRAQIRNPSPSFKYATVEGSSVETYFRRQVELSSMYLFMKDKNYKNAEQAIKALKEE